MMRVVFEKDHLLLASLDSQLAVRTICKISVAPVTRKKLITRIAMSAEIAHCGGCHCRSVRWQVEAPSSVVAWSCNCSDCAMRANIHFIVPFSKFKLLGDSEQSLTTYTFGTHTAKHKFCKICGITSFYIPRSNPDGIAVTVNCVDSGTLKHVEIRRFDGRNWESSYGKASISSFSKSPEK
ncbi:Centromere protein V [Ananas comosus]|uniref:Centromere protein V n=2 Tax=Ananas comosus TaxID=4615 RepID=A0A199UND3_ANACO|nr:Centromere protein V [Ananas comosus]